MPFTRSSSTALCLSRALICDTDAPHTPPQCMASAAAVLCVSHDSIVSCGSLALERAALLLHCRGSPYGQWLQSAMTCVVFLCMLEDRLCYSLAIQAAQRHVKISC